MRTELVDPSGIDLSFVPRLRATVVTLPIDDEAVLYDEESGTLHQLDPIARLVCSLFDGETPVRVFVDDLAAAFEADRAVVKEDVLRMTRHMGSQGLLEGVKPATSDEGETDGR